MRKILKKIVISKKKIKNHIFITHESSIVIPINILNDTIYDSFVGKLST